MKVTFLGTGTSQGVPIIGCDCPVCTSLDFRDKRLRVSVHIEVQGQSFIIDTGPDFRQQVLRERIRKLDALLFTHEHKDHIAGMDDVRGFNFLQNQDMPVYSEQRVLDRLRVEFAYAFAEVKYPGVPQINLHEVGLEPFFIGGVEIIPVRVWHYKLPILGFRIGPFAYITDANRIDPEERDKLRGCQVLVLNGLQEEPHISHFTLAEALEVMADLKPEMGYLTHISHKLGRHKDVEAKMPENVRLAYDGLSLSLSDN